ncbi:MAG TPA: hypothetical protein VFD43_02830 [Planctomycetota bacterium]|nr:hypothetical protein [Planctomycetota bacterium]
MDWLGELYARLLSTATIVETADGGLLVQSAPGRYAAWVAVFLVLLPGALWCWRRGLGGRMAIGACFASFTIPLIVVPGIAAESIRVGPAALSVRTGFWFAPTVRELPLSDLNEIVQTSESVAQRGAERSDRVWEFRYRSAPSIRLKLPDLLDAHRATVSAWLRARGLAVREE